MPQTITVTPFFKGSMVVRMLMNTLGNSAFLEGLKVRMISDFLNVRMH